MRKYFPLLLLVLCFAVPSLACETLTSTSTKLVFSPDTLPAAQVGQPYSAVVTLSNQRTPAFSMGADPESLPPGLTGEFNEDQQTYTISGAPTQAGTYPITVSALCFGTNTSGQQGEKSYQLIVK